MPLTSPQPEVVESIEIDAAPAVVWAAVSDPAGYARWSPEASGVMRRRPAPGHDGSEWAVGDRFLGTNRHWLPWATSCRVVRADPISGEFAFEVDLAGFPAARWAYEVVPLPEGRTRVTERWTDRRVGLRGALVKPAGLLVGRGYDAAARNRTTMRETLARLKADLDATTTGDDRQSASNEDRNG